MQHLSGMDNLFLTFEGIRHPMHVACMGIYDPSTAPGGAVRFKTVLDFFNTKIHQVPFFRRRLIKAPLWIDRPHWIEDGEVDVEFHVRHIALPDPGDWRQLMIQVARIHARQLDMSRPLWEAYVIGGLDNIDGIAPGSFALYIKMHHSGMDGQGGALLTQVLHSLTPDYNPIPKSVVIYADREPSDLELSIRGMVHRGVQVADASRLAFTLARKTLHLGNKYSSEMIELAQNMVYDALGFSDNESFCKSTNEQTRFDQKLSSHRVVDAFGLNIEDCQTIRKNIGGVTINDIFLAATSGGIRKYLSTHRELPEQGLNALMPLAIMGESRNENSANNITMMSIAICSDIEDPIERLMAVKKEAGISKQVQEDLGRDLASKLFDVIPAHLAKKLAKMAILKNSSLTVSNVRGPDIPLYLAGAKMQMFMPISVPMDGVGLNVTGFSYAGTLWVSMTACREMVPDPGFMSQCIKDSFQELLDASSEWKKKTEVKTAKSPIKTKQVAKKVKATQIKEDIKKAAIKKLSD